MQDPGLSSALVRFDIFEVDLRAGELRKEGRLVKLQEQPLRVLSLLLERSGEVVTRDELRQNLWPADTFVDFDHGLNSAVARLRQALRDSAEKPRLIETVAKRGYRFIGSLDARIDDAPAALPPVSDSGPHAVPVPLVQRQPRSLWLAGVPLLVLLGAVGLWAYYRKTAEKPLPSMEMVPLVGLRGFQVTPAFSPDGNQVAFRDSDGAHNTGVYTTLVGGGKSLRLASDPGDCCPAWSPDGRQIAFIRYSDKTASIVIVPALGGAEHHVYQGPNPMRWGWPGRPTASFWPFPRPGLPISLAPWVSLLSLSDYSIRPVTSPPGGSLDRRARVLSRRLPARLHPLHGGRSASSAALDLYVTRATGGEAKRLTFDHRPIMGPPTWTADGREVVFSSTRGGPASLWRIPSSGGEPRPVAGAIGEAGWPSIPPQGDQLVYQQVVAKFNIWRLELKDQKHSRRPPAVLISEKGDKMRPDLSPDGRADRL